MKDPIDPHFVRFTRTLALGASLALAAGCGASSTGDSGTSSDVASNNDAVSTDGGGTCSTCDCRAIGTDVPNATLPSCYEVNLSWCCAAIGPLPPPELA